MVQRHGAEEAGVFAPRLPQPSFKNLCDLKDETLNASLACAGSFFYSAHGQFVLIVLPISGKERHTLNEGYTGLAIFATKNETFKLLNQTSSKL